MMDSPRLHPSITGDPWMTVKVSRHRTAASSDEEVTCPRGRPPCGVCAGGNTICVFYVDESSEAMRKYFMEFVCRDCGNYTTWSYDD